MVRGANGTLPCHRGARDARAGRRFGGGVARKRRRGQIGRACAAGLPRMEAGMAERPESWDDGVQEAGEASPSKPVPRPADARAGRLAAQLKANLKRRKDQARGRAAHEGEDG